MTLPIFLLLFLVAPHSLANDSAASVAAGGIQLKREARVSMEKERLFISEKEVTVDYDFLNETDQEITTEVAFPVPAFSFTPEDAGGIRNFGFTYARVAELDPSYRQKEREDAQERAKTDSRFDTQWTDFHLRPIEESCVDPALVSALTAKAKKKYAGSRNLAEGDVVSLHWVDYILTTANSWKTPIKDFELIVERPKEENGRTSYAGFCWDGNVQRVDPMHFIARVSDFVPKKELRVVFLGI